MLTLENLEDDSLPMMVYGDLDLPFEQYTEETDKSTHVQFRVNAKTDWGRVDWKKCELIDPKLPCVHFY